MGGTGDTRRPRLGLLLVHGIGEQRPGAFLEEFRDGLGRLLQSGRIAEIERYDPGDPARRIHAAAIELDDRTLMLYEVHWADLVTPEMARASFDPIQLFLLAWFPWFNKQLKLPGFDVYSQREIAGWTYRLVPLSVLFFLGYIGVKAIRNFWRSFETIEVVMDRCERHGWRYRQRTRPPSGLALRPAGFEAWSVRIERDRLRRWMKGRPLRQRTRLEQAIVRTWLDRLLDQYAGDVVTFITSMARLPRLREDLTLARAFRGDPPTDMSWLPQDLVQSFVEARRRESHVMGLAERAMGRFEGAAWVATMQDHCTEIQVLGHSLGTLVSYHAMNRAPAGSAPATATTDTCSAALTRLHTIGSPLEKIHFFWPRLIAPRGDRPSLCGRGPAGRSVAIDASPKFAWKNYYSVSDKVSGALTRFQGWGRIDNHRLPGLGGVLSAHVAYKHNARFLSALMEQVGMPVAPQPSGWMRSALAWTWSASQALMLPLIAATVCLLGITFVAGFSAFAAVMITALVSSIGYVVTAPFGGAGGTFWYGRVFFWLTALMFVSLSSIIALVVPGWAKRAARASVARWWRAAL